MSLNWREIDLVLEELDLPGYFIQQVREPDYRHLQMELYRPGNKLILLISLTPGRTRIHSVTRKREKTVSSPPFESLLKSRIKNGKIIHADQLGEERIVQLTVSKAGLETRLWIRLWGNAANIIAQDEEGMILDAFYRRPNRGEVAGGTFNPDDALLTGKSSPAAEFSVREYPEQMTFNRYLEESYGRMEGEKRRIELSQRAAQIHEAMTGRLRRGLLKLKEKRDKFSNFSRYKEWGDIIMANLHTAKTGDRWLEGLDFYRDNSTIKIELDPELSPEENSAGYYELYKKEKSGYENLEEQIRNQEHKLRILEKEYEEISASPETGPIEEYIKKYRREISKKSETGPAMPGLQFQSAPFSILVGRTAKENDALLRNHVRGNDYWLHARDYPGGYVFIKTIPGKSVPLDTLLDAANLALYYSKGRNSGKGDVYYTQVKYLRRAKGEKRGTVLPTQEKNLSVRLEPERIDNIRRR
ncbi:MAG: NFACT RNA binding domain-containing protein [Spirochaetia bacterium]